MGPRDRAGSISMALVVNRSAGWWKYCEDTEWDEEALVGSIVGEDCHQLNHPGVRAVTVQIR